MNRYKEVYETYATQPIDENLSTPQGKEMKRQRSIQLEGVFGLLKQDIEYTQIRRRGIQNVKKRYIQYALDSM